MITFDDYTEIYNGELITLSITHHHGGERLVTGCIGTNIVVREKSNRSKADVISDLRQRVRNLSLSA